MDLVNSTAGLTTDHDGLSHVVHSGNVNTTPVAAVDTGSSHIHEAESSTVSVLTSDQGVSVTGTANTAEVTTIHLLKDISKETGLSSGATAGIVLAVLLLIGVVVAVLIFFWRKRPGNENIRVWQENSVHAVPDLSKARTTWHENDPELSAGEHSDFNPDLELQPVNIFRSSSAFANSDDDSSVFNDSLQMPQKPVESKETVVFDAQNKSFKVQNDNETNKYVAKGDNDKENVENAVNNSPEHVGTGSTQYTAVRKNSASFKVVNESDGFNSPPEDSNNTDGEEYFDMDSKSPTIDTETDSDDCVEDQSEENLSKADSDDVVYEPMSVGEDTGNDAYTNVDIIRRVQSVHASVENNLSERSDHVHRRAFSETQETLDKPPIALPRKSKKKRVDNYDYPPNRSLTGSQVDTFMSTKLPPGYDYVDEASFIANRERNDSSDTTEDIYKVPRT